LAAQRATTGLYAAEIGTDLSIEEYDVLIISNPWLVDFEHRLPARRVVGMLYDLVPNLYSLTSTRKPFAFAGEHQRGLSYYRDLCDSVLAISPAVADDATRYFHIEPERTGILPPPLRMSNFDHKQATSPRAQNVILAAPFDPRKGLADMPAILNGAAEAIETLSIYGGVRCSKPEVIHFFESLKIKHVEWRPAATSHAVSEMFHSAKVLLFPSLNEGLGLPILEAQVCGCRVITRNRAPMNTLLLEGSHLLIDSGPEDSMALGHMLTDSFDHDHLRASAREYFAPAELRHNIEEMLCSDQTSSSSASLAKVA
ncbi:MAG TPA: glycosyltransferase family 4 protein, partial [Pirellulaceae bacterium]|nr:glycosyltransferase family 4 protein [Pirellulaceae bacterium]